MLIISKQSFAVGADEDECERDLKLKQADMLKSMLGIVGDHWMSVWMKLTAVNHGWAGAIVTADWMKGDKKKQDVWLLQNKWTLSIIKDTLVTWSISSGFVGKNTGFFYGSSFMPTKNCQISVHPSWKKTFYLGLHFILELQNKGRSFETI